MPGTCTPTPNSRLPATPGTGNNFEIEKRVRPSLRVRYLITGKSIDPFPRLRSFDGSKERVLDNPRGGVANI
ncbi:hypothetical protein TNCT_625041 [Trichonephila clavata]|uniref:Uncharacterized protein n=1 Tax=Trichonephila clavata TaxID=2740835 RepID=A0A8X6HTX1_TRICU|nr:hypothetical protein TNCT_625041 [Trichonephila clavata]